MTEYVFNDGGKGRSFTVVTKELPNRPQALKRIARFENGKFTTKNPRLFQKLKKDFPYEINYDKPQKDYRNYHRNDLLTLAAKRGLGKEARRKNKEDIIRILEDNDAKEGEKE